jgi:hypothetical protein
VKKEKPAKANGVEEMAALAVKYLKKIEAALSAKEESENWQ